jgi:hypothetical protein
MFRRAAHPELPTPVQEILDDLRTGRLRIEAHDPAAARAQHAVAHGAYAGLVVAGGLLFVLAGPALVAQPR